MFFFPSASGKNGTVIMLGRSKDARLTVIDVAIMTENQSFLAHPLVQHFLTRLWSANTAVPDARARARARSNSRRAAGESESEWREEEKTCQISDGGCGTCHLPPVPAPAYIIP